jgi:hypothetical protein
MSASDAVTETFDEAQNGFTGKLESLAGTLGPTLARQAGSGNLAAASGVVSMLRGVRTVLKGDRKRGVLQALGGLFWLGVALAQRRSGGGGRSGRSSSSADELSEVADTSPDVEEAVEPGDRDGDHATGAEVVNTTDADIAESDTAPEVESDVDAADVNPRDVADSTDAADAVEGDTSAGDSETDGRPDEETAEGDD